jgi:hypothetical protein
MRIATGEYPLTVTLPSNSKTSHVAACSAARLTGTCALRWACPGARQALQARAVNPGMLPGLQNRGQRQLAAGDSRSPAHG